LWALEIIFALVEFSKKHDKEMRERERERERENIVGFKNMQLG
jgi:hypothetical protein